MDAKITLSFDAQIIRQAKAFAAEHNISLSRLTELVFRQMTSEGHKNLDELPISEWIDMVAEGRAEYVRTPNRKSLKSEFFDSKK